MADFPRIRWVLVGDDGQHDLGIYAAFAAATPDRVRAIALRDLPEDRAGARARQTGALGSGDSQLAVPEVRGGDGGALAAAEAELR